MFNLHVSPNVTCYDVTLRPHVALENCLHPVPYNGYHHPPLKQAFEDYRHIGAHNSRGRSLLFSSETAIITVQCSLFPKVAADVPGGCI
jgi:hypothetical protein